MQAVAHAGDADEHLAVVDQGRRTDADAGRAGLSHLRQRVVAAQLARRLGACPHTRRRRCPTPGAGLRVEGNEAAVHRADVDLAARHRHAAIGGPAAELGGARLVLVAPELAAARGIERRHAAERQRHVDDAIDHDRRRLEGRGDAAVPGPLRHQPAHRSGIDGGEGRVALAAQVMAMERPGVGLRQRRRRECCEQCRDERVSGACSYPGN